MNSDRNNVFFVMLFVLTLYLSGCGQVDRESVSKLKEGDLPEGTQTEYIKAALEIFQSGNPEVIRAVTREWAKKYDAVVLHFMDQNRAHAIIRFEREPDGLFISKDPSFNLENSILSSISGYDMNEIPDSEAARFAKFLGNPPLITSDLNCMVSTEKIWKNEMISTETTYFLLGNGGVIEVNGAGENFCENNIY